MYIRQDVHKTRRPSLSCLHYTMSPQICCCIDFCKARTGLKSANCAPTESLPMCQARARPAWYDTSCSRLRCTWVRDSGLTVQVTLWGSHAEDDGGRLEADLSCGLNPVISLSHLRITDFNGAPPYFTLCKPCNQPESCSERLGPSRVAQ